MLFRLFLAFSLIPLIEIYLLIKAGSFLGAEWTILLVLVTGFAGASLAKMQGLSTAEKIRENMRNGIAPTAELVDAALIFAAGMVLLTPGFITDALGILMLIPTVRDHFKKWVRDRLDKAAKSGSVTVIRY